MEQTNDKAPTLTLTLPRDYKRPSLEEFVAANYDAKDYEQFFQAHEARLAAAYAAGEVTDESYRRTKQQAQEPLVEGLPDALHVQSQVRRVGTRTTRVRQPTRHRFKQYLFGDPSKRLVRNGKVSITSRDLVTNLDELRSKERAGILSVHATDGRRVNLDELARRLSGEAPEEQPEQNTPVGEPPAAPAPLLSEPPAPAPLPNPPLDSIANDTPAGENRPMFVDGTFPGDPAAERALERMTEDKSREIERNAESSDDSATPPAPASTEESTPSDDPAVERAAKGSSKKKGGHK